MGLALLSITCPTLSGADLPGRVWEETEGGWKGTWTRRGASNIFDAFWIGPGGEQFRDVLTMTLDGSHVTIRREKVPGLVYRGVIHGNRTASGTASDGNASGTWRATIQGGASGDGTVDDGEPEVQPAPSSKGGGRTEAGGSLLGKVWDEIEGGWKGTWKRRGNSNVFDASWVGPDGRTVHDVLTMTLRGSRVTIHRQNLPNHVYQGVIHGDGTVSGTASDGRGSTTWKAVIRSGSAAPEAAADPLGRVWEETEGGWKGIWTRRGTSNIFDAAWVGPGGEQFRDVLTMTLDGNRVTIRRRKVSNLVYKGVIRGNNTASGTASDGNASGTWKAVIRQ